MNPHDESAAPSLPTSDSARLRADARAIWQAGVDAVGAERLVQEFLRLEGDTLLVGPERIPLAGVRRILVVGAGKAGAGMAAGVEQALGAAGPGGESIADAKRLSGWINVPADCVRPLRWLTLHAARPAGLNEPTAEGVCGARRILDLVAAAGPDDLCLCLISGGGSALLPAPVPGVSLDDKQRLTRTLSALGANIRQLNTVRKQLSCIKGGGLARACRAGRLVTLIISDVLGDPLDVIASGPTVPDTATPRDALEVLQTLGARQAGVPQSVFDYLEERALAMESAGAASPPTTHVVNYVIGANAVAVRGAAAEARRRGYRVIAEPAEKLEGLADDVGEDLARRALELRSLAEPTCLITGGEPTVKLAPSEQRGRGGRNQQLVLAALRTLSREPRGLRHACDGLALLSGGTDGEDGPTDAAGALIDSQVCEQLAAKPDDVAAAIDDALARNDAYRFFAPLAALLVTGPTHTNVCDVRVVVAGAKRGECGAAEANALSGLGFPAGRFS